MLFRLLLIVLSLAAFASAQAAKTVPATHPADWVPLRIDLPKPPYVSWQGQLPRDAEKPRMPRPPLMVPPGTVLLSRGKPVTSSDAEPIIGELKQVTDGDKSYEEGHWVELKSGVQWVQVDLEKPCMLQAVIFWRIHWMPRAYNDVIVQVSNDPQFKENVTTLFNNDTDDSSGLGKGTDRRYVETIEGKLLEANGITARYIRLYSNGNTEDEGNQCAEVEVFGLPAADDDTK